MSEYRLFHGDCLEILPRLAEEGLHVDAVVTDPPYGTTSAEWDNAPDYGVLFPMMLAIMLPNAPILSFCQEPICSELRLQFLRLYRYDFVWVKTRPAGFANANRMPMRIHERILVFYRRLPTYNPIKQKVGRPYTRTYSYDRHAKKSGSVYRKGTLNKTYTRVSDGTRYPTDVLYFANDSNNSVHPTQKPDALLRYLILTYTNPGDTVLDPFMGSGTTGVACMQTGRNFIGIELDEGYYNTAKKRIEDAASQPLLLQSQGGLTPRGADGLRPEQSGANSQLPLLGNDGAG